MINNIISAYSNITMMDFAVFLIPFIAAIMVDLMVHKKHKPISISDAAMWSVVWVVCSMMFAGYIWFAKGAEAASLFATGYILEKALAVDNLFAFFLIFSSFGLVRQDRQHNQHTILYWGIMGAIVFRVVFLGAGAVFANISDYVLIAFACVILWTVYKMWKDSEDDGEVDYTNHWSVSLVKNFCKTNPSIDSGKFFHNGVTPLFLCLVCIEICDVIFAFDSMPVIVAVVRDPYLMITSSLWAAAGLRSLYFLLIAAQNKLWALDKAVMVLLVVVAAKLIGTAFGIHVPNEISLSIIAFILCAGVVWSLVFKNPEGSDDDETEMRNAA